MEERERGKKEISDEKGSSVSRSYLHRRHDGTPPASGRRYGLMSSHGLGGGVFTKQNRNECTENSVALPSTVSGGQKIEPKMLE